MMTLTVSNYQITVFTTEQVVGECQRIGKGAYGCQGKDWCFKVYKHVIPPRFVNVTGIRSIESELPIVIRLIESLYKVHYHYAKVNIVFASRNFAMQKLSYCLSSMKKLGQALYGDHFFFFYEPEFGSVLQMTSRQRTDVCLMMYGTGSVCCFVPDLNYINFCEDVLNKLYVESNLKTSLKASDQTVENGTYQ